MLRTTLLRTVTLSRCWMAPVLRRRRRRIEKSYSWSARRAVAVFCTCRPRMPLVSPPFRARDTVGPYSAYALFWFTAAWWTAASILTTLRARALLTHTKFSRNMVLSDLFMPASPDCIDEGTDIMFLGCPVVSFVRSCGQILLPRYLTNGLNTMFSIKLTGIYSVAPTDDLIRFWTSKVKG